MLLHKVRFCGLQSTSLNVLKLIAGLYHGYWSLVTHPSKLNFKNNGKNVPNHQPDNCVCVYPQGMETSPSKNIQFHQDGCVTNENSFVSREASMLIEKGIEEHDVSRFYLGYCCFSFSFGVATNLYNHKFSICYWNKSPSAASRICICCLGRGFETPKWFRFGTPVTYVEHWNSEGTTAQTIPNLYMFFWQLLFSLKWPHPNPSK